MRLIVAADFADQESAKHWASRLMSSELIGGTLLTLTWTSAAPSQIERMQTIFDELHAAGKLMAPAKIQTDDKQTEPQRSEVPIARKAANLGKAIKRAGKAFLQNKPVMASDDEAARRLSICERCVHYDDGRCADITLADGTIEQGCGCNLKAKTKMETESCAYNKW